jgi:hypothetical protein
VADLDTLGLGESAAAVGTVVTGVELIEPEAFVGDAVPALDAVDEVVAPRLDGGDELLGHRPAHHAVVGVDDSERESQIRQETPLSVLNCAVGLGEAVFVDVKAVGVFRRELLAADETVAGVVVQYVRRRRQKCFRSVRLPRMRPDSSKP